MSDFMALLADKTGVPVGAQEVLAGFPPRPLALSGAAGGSSATVASLGIQAGDSLTVRQLAGQPQEAPAAHVPATMGAVVQHDSAFSLAGMSEDEQLARAIAASLGEPVEPPAAAPAAAAAAAPYRPAAAAPPLPLVKGQPAFELLPDGAAVARRIVADDNSCLFSAVGYVTQGSRAAAPTLRTVIAEAVLADPFEWNEVVLGKDPAEYAAWIKNPKMWGGAIELSIFSAKLGKEIAAFDIQTERVDVYGQGSGYSERVLLVYDGLHYDALAVAAGVGAAEGRDVAVIPSAGPRTDAVMAAAARLVARFHAARQFTDVANFTLRCGTCKVGLKGEKEALKHATDTGHSNFEEY